MVSDNIRDTLHWRMLKSILNNTTGLSHKLIRPFPWRYRGLLVLPTLVFSAPLWSHAFEQRYDLPLPLAMYLWGGGITVAVSFLIAGIFLRTNLPARSRWQRDISQSAGGRFLQATVWTFSLKLLAIALFLLILASGFYGAADPGKNLTPIFVWVIWWVGMAYVSALLGNLWDLVNPWRILYSTCLQVFNKADIAMVRYPESLACWPAAGFFIVFTWLEFISGIADQADQLVWIIVIYSLITFLGMRLFGARTWLENGEIFTVVFGLMARFGILRGEIKPQRRLIIRLPGQGLLSEQPVSLSMMTFTLLMLASVSFDGFVETPLWQEMSTAMYRLLQNFSLFSETLTQQGLRGLVLTIALALFYLLFVAVYLLCCVVVRLTDRRQSVLMIARIYVLSLVPIAIAYHLAHYFSYLLLAGQLIIPVMSDPFQLGWNLFATVDYQIDIGVFDAGNVWYLSLFAIVIGHIFAVWIAHITALRVEANPRTAMISQIPLLILMIAYTMISLWILSQPIVS